MHELFIDEWRQRNWYLVCCWFVQFAHFLRKKWGLLAHKHFVLLFISLPTCTFNVANLSSFAVFLAFWWSFQNCSFNVHKPTFLNSNQNFCTLQHTFKRTTHFEGNWKLLVATSNRYPRKTFHDYPFPSPFYPCNNTLPLPPPHNSHIIPIQQVAILTSAPTFTAHLHTTKQNLRDKRLERGYLHAHSRLRHFSNYAPRHAHIFQQGRAEHYNNSAL